MTRKPLTLGVLASSLHIGGAEQMLLELLRRLDPGRVAPRLYLLGEPGPIGREIIGLGLPWQGNLRRGRFDACTVSRLRRAFSRDGLDALLLINHRNALAFGVPAAALAGVAPVVNWENETFKRYRFHRAFMLLRRLLMRRVDAVVAAARGHRLYIAREEHVPLNKVVCIPNSVDAARFRSDLSPAEAKSRLGIPASRKVAGILAVLRPDKAHEMFLEAASRVLAAGLDAHFLIIGDGPRREELEALARRLGIAERVSFLGFRRELGDILAALDLAALSSKPQQETLSVAALEVMAAGVPMVATRVGFMSEIVIPGETGLLVEPGDTEGLSRAMAGLLRDDDARRAMGEKARDMVEREYGLDGMARAFENLFEGLRAKKDRDRQSDMTQANFQGRARRTGREPCSRSMPRRVLILTTWADDGDWYFLNRLRELGHTVDLLEPLFLRSRWAPGWLKRLSIRLCSLYQPVLALARSGRHDATVTWNTRTGTVLGVLLRLVPERGRPTHILRDFHLDLTRFADPVYMLRILMVRLAVPGIDAFLTTSGEEADLYGSMFSIPPDRILFFPDTPGGAFMADHEYPREDYVFAYGNSDRDFDTLLTAAPAIPGPVVVLSQSWRPSGPVPANVTVITRRLPQAELLERIARSRAVVIPIKSHHVAAGQNAMLEVMCLSRPLVVTSNMTTLEHARDGHDALFTPPGDAAALARAVTRLLSDPALARTLGENARRTALAFPERQVEIFLDVLARLTGPDRGGHGQGETLREAGAPDEPKAAPHG